MTTRLTNEMRNEIADSVIAATNLPDERKEIERLTSEVARDWMLSQQPPEFVALVKGHPAQWFHLDNDLYVREHNPLQVLEISLWSHSINYPAPVPIAVNTSPSPAECQEIFGDLCARAEKWVEQRDQVRGELMAYLNSCRTVEKALENMPELTPHVPKAAAKVYPLVAPSNVLSKLSQLGFDRTQPAQKAA